METPIFTDIPTLSLLMAFLVAMALSMMVLPSIRSVSRRWSLYDFNISHEVTLSHIPRLGGIAMVVGFAVSTAVFTPLGFVPGIRFILAALFLLLAAGLQDDLLHLSAFMRLIFVVAAGAIITDIAKMPLLQTNLPLIFNYPLADLLATYAIFVGCVLLLVQASKIPGLLSLILLVCSVAVSVHSLKSGIPALAVAPLALAGASTMLLIGALGEYVFEGKASALIGGFLLAILLLNCIRITHFLPGIVPSGIFIFTLLILPLMVFFKKIEVINGELHIFKKQFSYNKALIIMVIIFLALVIV